MRRIAITLIFMLSVFICFGQLKTDKYILTVSFEPAFISTSKLIINSDSAFIYLKIFKGTSEDKVKIAPQNLDLLTHFLENYKFQIKNNFDTLTSKKNGTIEIVEGNDGVTVKGIMRYYDKQKKFQFWSPHRGTANRKLIELLFDIIGKSNLNEKSINYIQELKKYFQ